MILGKISLILLLMGLLNENKTSESMHNFNPYFNRILAENILTLLPNNLHYLQNHPNKNKINYFQDQRYLLQASSPMSTPLISLWMYSLPFSITSHCDSLLIYDAEFNRCRANGAVYWNINDSSGSVQKSSKNTCCFIWNLLDCMEEAVNRKCSYSVELFHRNRMEYVSRIQANPLCYNYNYGSWICFQENWPLVLSFSLLGLFIGIVLCAAFWILACRKFFFQKNRKIKNANDYVDSDIESQDQHKRSIYRQQPKQVENQHSVTKIKELNSQQSVNVLNGASFEEIMNEGYESPRKLQLYRQQPQQQSQQQPRSQSTKSPELRSASAVSLRQIHV